MSDEGHLIPIYDDPDQQPLYLSQKQLWTIMERSHELHRGEAELIDGEVVIAMLRDIVDKAAERTRDE